MATVVAVGVLSHRGAAKSPLQPGMAGRHACAFTQALSKVFANSVSYRSDEDEELMLLATNLNATAGNSGAASSVTG